jgi:hypothetical protein
MKSLGFEGHNVGTTVLNYWSDLLAIYLYMQEMNVRTIEKDSVVKCMFGVYICYALHIFLFLFLKTTYLFQLINYVIMSVIYCEAEEAPAYIVCFCSEMH